jgi:hypothetical protein
MDSANDTSMTDPTRKDLEDIFESSRDHTFGVNEQDLLNKLLSYIVRHSAKTFNDGFVTGCTRDTAYMQELIEKHGPEQAAKLFSENMERFVKANG